jgi:hypothetical protein
MLNSHLLMPYLAVFPMTASEILACAFGDKLFFLLRIAAFGESGCTIRGWLSFRVAPVPTELAERSARLL